MQKEWSSFRITLLLYIIVLLLPFSFYFVHTSFKTMQQDTKIVRKSSWIMGSINHLAIDPTNKNNQQTIKDIDKTLNEISTWAKKNNDSKLYVGTESLSKDFSEVNTCWNSYKGNLSSQNATQCYNINDNLAIIIEKMVYMKQNSMINMFYLSLTIAMILLLLVIYLVRVYIHIQMKRHAIHDHETTLFNKKYFLAELKSTYARAVRHEYPLSILEIEIEGFEKGSTRYDKKTKLHTLKAFGTLIHSLVRDGDLPSRYDENHFLMLLPFTNKENAFLFEKRIRQSLMQDDCIISEKIKLNFLITELDKEETKEEFLQRTLAT